MGIVGELEPAVLAAVFVALMMGGLVKGVIGFAFPMVSVPLLSSIVDVRFALVAMVIPIVVTNLWQAVQGGFFLWAAKRFWPVVCGLAMGIWIGANLAVLVDENTLFLVLGIVAIVFTAISHLQPDLHLPERYEKPVGAFAGLLGGISGGMFTVWGPPMLMFLVARRLGKEAFIGAVGLIWFCGSIFLTISFTAVDILGEDNVAMSALALVPVLAGMGLGMWLRGWINQETFRKAVLVALFLVGLNLLRRALF